MYYYEVAPTRIFRANSEILTYSSPTTLPKGTLVNIPLGKQTCPGLVLRSAKQPDFPTKNILSIIDSQPLPNHLVQGLIWLSQYYATPLPQVIQSALPAGITKKRRQKLRPSSSPVPTNQPSVPLNTAQQTALKEIQKLQSHTILLHGITGSGKTNIYLSLASATIKQQQSVILLVPEIALTSQLVQNFQKHFKDVVLIHSELSESARHQTWLHLLHSTQPQIVIGPRSALFAPISKLGLIIIDEAHEPAYYQEQNPKYSAIRLASILAKSASPCTKVLLGTATPTIADYYLFQHKKAIVTLNQRAIPTAQNATIKIIDLKDSSQFTKNPFFANALLNSIEQSLREKRQSLIFHNRRGSAPLTICENCGWQALCPYCFLPLTLHHDQFALFCHNCGYKQKVPTSCPECHNAQIIHKGFGTKQLESELNKIFPNARIIRFDADTDSNEQLKNIYPEVHNGDYHIIIGTQMIAKGFDFPLLKTLGVVQADAGLFLPDFTASERNFILLNQVIGRANRGHQASEIFIQSYQPDHFSITTATANDYSQFYQTALADRQRAGLPPFYFLLKLTVTYKTEATTLKHIQSLHQHIKLHFPRLIVSQPTPDFHERSRQGYTWQLVVKSKSRTQLLDLIHSLPITANLRFSLDPPTLLN